MAERIPAYDTSTGQKTLVNRRWVDNPAIKGGRYTAKPPRPKTSRKKQEPVDTPAVDETAPDTKPGSAGDTAKE